MYQPEKEPEERLPPEQVDELFSNEGTQLPARYVPTASFAEESVVAEIVADPADEEKPPVQAAVQRPRKRRVWLPIILFLITCVSTFFAGVTQWWPPAVIDRCVQFQSAYGLYWAPTNIDLMPLRRAVISNWDDGLIFMACVLLILFTHEMGHFLATVWYRIPASFPYFLPLPISPIGTLGAVIGMDSMRADRKQMFDIGLAGPLAGLVVAIPIIWVGVVRLDLTGPEGGFYYVDVPLAMKAALTFAEPPGYAPDAKIWNTQLNPFLMAGWVGLLITGLNMLPISQLDGGHVTYALFRRNTYWIARLLLFSFIIYVIASDQWKLLLQWALMLSLVVLVIGIDHPPTRDDRVSLGWFRWILGCASLLIPIFCFAPKVWTAIQP
jgi:Zn-dependent protease